MRQLLFLTASFGLGVFIGNILQPKSLGGQPTGDLDVTLCRFNMSSEFLATPLVAADASSSPINLTEQCQELRRPTQLRLEGDFLKRDGEDVIMELPEVLKIINLEGEGGQARRDHIYSEFEKEMMMYEKWACATIFEDDVGLAHNFSGRVAATVDSLPPFDVILWGFCPGGSKPRHESADTTSIPKVMYGWPGSCVHAYTGAHLLTSVNSPVRYPPDGAMDGRHWGTRVRPYIDRRHDHHDPNRSAQSVPLPSSWEWKT
eukprot:g9105.t1